VCLPASERISELKCQKRSEAGKPKRENEGLGMVWEGRAHLLRDNDRRATSASEFRARISPKDCQSRWNAFFPKNRACVGVPMTMESMVEVAGSIK
jgi:hypothetical protein